MGPNLNTDSLLINSNTGPARPGTNEFNALFNRNDVRLQFHGIVGGLDTYGDQFVASALKDNFSYTLSQLHYETDGFIENDAAERDIYDLLVHGQVTQSTSIQLDLKSSDLSSGQTIYPFSDTPFPTTILEQSDTLRVSGHHMLDSGSNWVWSAVAEDRKRAVRSFPDGALFQSSDASPFAVEAQFLGRWGEVQLIAGSGYSDETQRFNAENAEIRNESANAYAYAQWKSALDTLSVQVGVTAEQFESTLTSDFAPDGETLLDRSQLSPKLGLLWSPRPGTTLRACVVLVAPPPYPEPDPRTHTSRRLQSVLQRFRSVLR